MVKDAYVIRAQNTLLIILRRDGSSMRAPRVGLVCGSNGLGFNYTSLGRSLYIRFRSDMALTSRGFKASWTNAGTGQGRKYNTFRRVLYSAR